MEKQVNSLRSKLGLAALIIIVSIGAGHFYLQHSEEKQRIEIANAYLAQYKAEELAKTKTETMPPFSDKAMNESIPKSYLRPKSEWKTTEKEIYQNILTSGNFDTLVVPFQVRSYALDRATRSLMTAELVLAMSTGQNFQIADPYLVSRALGDGDRRIDPQEIYTLANKLGVKRIIWGYVGHNREKHMSLTIQLQERKTQEPLSKYTEFTTKNFDNIPFSDENPPIEIYQSMLPEILKALNISDSAWVAQKPESMFDGDELPPSPKDMASEKSEPARDAYYFQVLAYLTPISAIWTRERFAEKSLLAISAMSPNSPDYRALKARAFMLLGLRPAALQILREPQSAEEKELVAMLNGNLPDVEITASQVKPAIKRLIAELDKNYLSETYGKSNTKQAASTTTSLHLKGKIWPSLVLRAFTEVDQWSQFENIYLKQLLDHEFPIKDFTAEGIIRGNVVIGDIEKIQTLADLSVAKHIRTLLENDPSKWCCMASLTHPTEFDYLNLLEGIGEDNLVRRAYLFSLMQGLPEKSLAFLNGIENIYKGKPAFSYARAYAQVIQSKNMEDTEKNSLLKSANENALNAMYWEQGQSTISSNAADLLYSTIGQAANLYSTDYPIRAYYPAIEKPNGGPSYQRTSDDYIESLEAALKNSTSNLRAFHELEKFLTRIDKTDKHEALFKVFEGRFIGNPERYILLAAESQKRGDIQSAENFYGESIKELPEYWQSYMSLGSIFIERGQLEKASNLFMSYPSHKAGTNDNAVTISNTAYEAGSKFYWLGEFDLASKFYKIASKRKTGSAADITSQLRLKLINRDYQGALSGSLERARRYGDSYAYRDYLGLLHVMGASKDAWEAFNVLSVQIDDAHVWETALVGHRKEKKSESEIAEWTKQKVSQNIGKEQNRAAKYLLRAGVTDRIPSKELGSYLADVEYPVYKEKTGAVMQQINGQMGEKIGQYRIVLGEPAHPRSRIKSDFVYFTEAYRAIRSGDMANAHSLLQEAFTFYNFPVEEIRYLLPYYAFTSAKVNDIADVQKHIETTKPELKDFDYYLAKALIDGVTGKTEDSLQSLRNALYRRPFTEERPLNTEYQYAEFCEWLYEATGNTKYKEIALDWAKKNQKFQPWFAWSYAMEAKLSSNKNERDLAIAMTNYLDPLSDRLSSIAKPIRDSAIKKHAGMKPFTNVLHSKPDTAI